MSECNWALLGDRGVIRVSGSDAQSFLQGIVTNDVTATGPSGGVYAALLTPQGKILFDFFIIADVDGFLIETAASRAEALLKRLSIYKLRADVALELMGEGYAVGVQWGRETPELKAGFSYLDPRHPGLGVRFIYDAQEEIPGVVDCNEVGKRDYHALRVSLGVAEGGIDFAYEDNFPHDANFDFLNGVDFGKGCFIGQEVVSRMKHRGTARKRIVRVAADGGTLEQGAEISADGMAIGSVGTVAGAQALALVRVDRALNALGEGKELSAGGVAVSLSSPPYADFGFPS